MVIARVMPEKVRDGGLKKEGFYALLTHFGAEEDYFEQKIMNFNNKLCQIYDRYLADSMIFNLNRFVY